MKDLLNSTVGTDSYPVTLVPPRGHVEGLVSLARFVQWGMLTFAAVLLLIPFGTFAEFPPSLVIWVTATLLFLLTFYCFTVARLSEENPWLTPASLLTSFYFFKYGWGALVVYHWDLLPWEVFPGIGDTFLYLGAKDFLPTSCQLILLAACGLYFGAAGAMPVITPRLPVLNWRIDPAKFELNLTLYVPLALALYILARPFLPLVIRDTVLLFGWAVWVIIVIGSYRVFTFHGRTKVKWVVLLVFTVLFHMVLGLHTGMRGNFLYPGLLIVLGYIIAKRRMPLKVLAIALPAIIFMVVPILTFYKSASVYGVQSVPDKLALTVEQTVSADAQTFFEIGLDSVFGRLAGSSAGALPVFSQNFPDPYPFERGRSFVLELQQLIPRILWPDKPNINVELNRYTASVGLLTEGGPTSQTFDAVSEYYLNFGLVGVFIFSFLHGYLYRVLYYWLVKRSHYEIGASIYIVFFFLNPDFVGVVLMLVSATRQLLVWPLMLWLLSRQSV